MQQHPIATVRYVAVSATIPNIQDLAHWLAVPPAGIKCFGERAQQPFLACLSVLCSLHCSKALMADGTCRRGDAPREAAHCGQGIQPHKDRCTAG
jgi:hypothetical protein